MTVTVGISIAIPEPHGEMLRDRRRSYGDPMADRIPSHITLAPPLEIEHDEVESIVARLGEVAAANAAFRVALLGTGSFRPVSPVVFVAVSEGIAQIELLARSLQDSLDAPAPDFPFHPHVTVAHNVPEEALDRALEDLKGFELHFEVAAFHLYVDDPDVGWVPTHTFPFG